MRRRRRGYSNENPVKLSPLEVGGKEFPAWVEPDTGRFKSEVLGEEVFAETLEELRTKVGAVHRRTRAKIKIECTYLGSRGSKGEELRDFIITGIHPNRNILVRWCDTNKAEQFSYYAGGDDIVRRMTKSEKEEYKSLTKAKRKLEDAIDKITKRCALIPGSDSISGRDIKTFIEEKIAEAEDDPGETAIEETEDPR